MLFFKTAQNRFIPRRVVGIDTLLSAGFLSPLTSAGSIVVNDVAVSCYAVVGSDTLAHWAFAPLRWWTQASAALFGVAQPHVGAAPGDSEGIRPYPNALFTLAKLLVPRSWSGIIDAT